MDDYVPTKTARKLLGVTSQTLRNWDEKGKINAVFTPSGVRLYSRKDICNILRIPYTSTEKRKVAYCRVSSNKQKDDLERQKDFFRTNYPNHEVVTDIGSGINWKRRGFTSLLESSLHGDISEIVVAHRDRLCRFAFDLVKFILETRQVKLIVLDAEEHQSESTELADDILSIIHVYSCRSMGKRRYQKQKNQTVSETTTDQDDEAVDGNV
jgi:predicted site-specific integrase-resolvase